MSSSPKSPSTLKRPAPPTRDSSSSIQAISPQKPTTSEPKPEEKEAQKIAEPPAKKAKIALVSGGAGSGGQTKLAFGKTGTGGQTRLNFGKTGSGSGTSASGSGSGSGSVSGGEKKTSLGGTGGSSSTGAGFGATTTIPPSLSTSSSPMRTHLLLPIPSLPPNHTPTQLSSHITALRQIKADFIALLTEEQKGLLGMEMESMGDDWFVGLRGEFVKGYFLELKRFIIAEQGKNKVFPPVGDVYSWTRFCPLAGIRVVIIGQDPYHNDGQAHGLAFSVRKGTPVPPSLRNMYKELENEYDGFKAPRHGDLSSWARQGVLLLNTSLTVRAHEANSHSKRGWETFTEKVLKLIVDRLSEKGAEVGGKGVVFLAWGAGAGKLVKGISERQHHILTSAHPSPLSASRGFMGNDHFKKCNEWLERQYGEGKGIDWTSVSKEE